MSEGVDTNFGNWLAGFIDGEGCFYITKDTTRGVYKARFSLSVRADDAAIIRAAHVATGLGSVHEYKATTGSMVIRWVIQSRAHTESFVQLLEIFPLRAKKKGDFEIWREAVKAQSQIRAGRANNDDVRAVMEGFKASLAAHRKAGITW